MFERKTVYGVPKEARQVLLRFSYLFDAKRYICTDVHQHAVSGDRLPPVLFK